MEDVRSIIRELQADLKVVLVASAKQADRDKRKTVVLEKTSHTHNAFRKFFDGLGGFKSQALLPSALEFMWEFFPYWQELDGRVGNAEDPGDGLLYKEAQVAQANSVLQDLYQAWSSTEALANQPPPANLPKVGKIGLVLTHMRQQGLLQDFLDSGCEDKDLPFGKDRLSEVLKPHHIDYAPTFATEQYRAVPRKWEEGDHLEIEDEEPLPLLLEAHYDSGSYGRVYRVRDPISGALYARKDQITISDHVSAAARRHLEEETKRLKNLKHRHVVEVVKTYQRGKAYGILLQPAATSDLQKLLGRNTKDKFYSEKGCKDSVWLRPLFLTAFGCLSHGLAYIHGRDIRHKDVKPANILYEKANNKKAARFLWADFGLAYDFSETGNSKTKSTKIYSPRYAAPEIIAANSKADSNDRRPSVMGMTSLNRIMEVDDSEVMIVEDFTASNDADAHGRAADVFSLGCVFLEMLAGLVKQALPLEKHDPTDEKRMFSHNIPALRAWAEACSKSSEDRGEWADLRPLFTLAIWMISPKPNDRPLVDAVVSKLVDAQIAAAGPAYFCQECWEELRIQGSLPPKTSKKPYLATTPSPAPPSPTSTKPSTGLYLLRRVSTGLSVKNVRPRAARMLSNPSSPVEAI